MAKIPTVYLFEIQLDHAKIPVWRVLEVPRNTSLHDFHLCIQVAMGWKCSHLYEFSFREKRYELPEPMTPVNDEVADPRAIRLMDMNLSLGDSLKYIYDFGDNWEHTITLIGYSRSDYGYKNIPRCSAGAMACPPEDLGGIDVYNQLVAFLLHKEPIEVYPDLERIYRKFDPWNEAIENDYFFAKAVSGLRRLYK
jgi:hypothetical protein